MKKIKYLHLLLIAGIMFLGSCSNDFLNDNQQNISLLDGTVLLSSKSSDQSVDLNLGIAGSEDYYITVFPKWMKCNSLQGKFEEGKTTLKFQVVEPEVRTDPDFLKGMVVLHINRIGLVGFNMVYGNIGNIPGEESDVQEIDGKVVDAASDKVSGTIVIATQNPDQLVVMQTASGESSKITLPKTPQCLDILSDGKSVLVGYNTPDLSLINLESKTVVRNFQIDHVPYDIVAGNNGWCYIAPQGESWVNLRSLNLTTGELHFNDSYGISQMYGSTIIKKIPGKQLLVGTRIYTGPSGIILFDIKRGAACDTTCYWHLNPVDLWASNDGGKLFNKSGIVYKVPDFIPTTFVQLDLPELGKLNLKQSMINDMDFCDSKSSIFVANGDNNQPGMNQGKNNVILQYDAGYLNLLRTYEPSYTAINKNNELVFAYSQVRYVFTNQEGTYLYAVRRTAPDFGVENWSVEKFEIQ